MTHLAENELQVQHGIISIFFFMWRGRVIVTFEGRNYIRLLKRRLSKKKAGDDAHEFAKWIIGETEKFGFDEVGRW